MLAWVLVSALTSARFPVSEVTVFSDRAQVVRRGQITCTPPATSVQFEFLPRSLDQKSLYARSDGDSKPMVLGVSAKVHENQIDSSPQTEKLRQQIIDVDTKMELLRLDIERGAQELSALDSYEKHFTVLANEDLRGTHFSEKRFDAFLATVAAQRMAIRKSATSKSREQAQLQRTRSNLESALEELGGAQAREYYDATVTLHCGSKGEATVYLAYTLPGATWRPEYQVHFNPSEKTSNVELTVGAIVRQATGEDWNDVRLSLSTAKPYLGGEAPQPAPIHVRGKDAAEQKVLVQSYENRETLSGSGRGAEASPVAEDLGQSFALRLPEKISITADGHDHWMPVEMLKGDAKATLVAVPAFDPRVYRMLRFHNPATYSLISGNVQLYDAGLFVGSQNIELHAPGEPMELTLNQEGSVFVERTETNKQDRSPEFLSSTKRIDYAYTIETHNQSATTLTVEVLEAIPVSKTEEIGVEIEPKTTSGYAFDKLRGFLRWQVSVKPGAKSAVQLAYTVSLPEGWQSRGL